ncbi:MAG: Ig-like domain-containing protein [Armatimonadota bacterium]|nr:Ig-like domain-containing protein [Armatimonadota bacterium]
MTGLYPLFVRPAILQNNPNQFQPFVCFILPESSTISHPFLPIIVAVILPAEISQNYTLSDIFVFAENDFIITFPLTDQPTFDEKTNSFLWLFFGSYEVPLEQPKDQIPNLIPLTLSAYALFEPNQPSLSALSAYDEFPILLDLTSFGKSEQEEKESAQVKDSGSGKTQGKEGKRSEGKESEGKGQVSGDKLSSQAKKEKAKEAAKRAIDKDPELARKIFEQEITAKALSNAKKNPKSIAKVKGLIIAVGAYPDVLPADGKSTAFIVAKVTDEKGNSVVGKEVRFASDGGKLLVSRSVTDERGVALSRLCSEVLPEGKKKFVKVVAKTNPEVETTILMYGGSSFSTTSGSNASLSVWWWSQPPNTKSLVCAGNGSIAAGFAGLAAHVVVPSSPMHFVYANFLKVIGDGHPYQKQLGALYSDSYAPCAPSVGQGYVKYSWAVYPEMTGWQHYHRSDVTLIFNYTVARPFPPPGQFWTEERRVTVQAKNAILKLSPNNPPVLKWDPENTPPESQRTISFRVETPQTAQVRVSISIYRCHRYNNDSPVKRIEIVVPTNQDVMVTWDGSVDGTGMPGGGNMLAEKGLYAYDVLALVQQVVPNRFDADWRCSRNMQILRATDREGREILEAEYYGYDDNGTEGTEDDGHLYFIKWYVLKCGSAQIDDDGDAGSEWLEDRDGDKRFDEDWVDGIDNDGDGRVDEDPGGGWDEDPEDGRDNDGDGRVDEDRPNPVNASRGEVLLYDPDLEMVASWDLQSLLCLEHNENDGLVASLEGVRHGVLVRVPVSLMQKAGTYYFVLRVWDNHAHLHKDHQVKPALELNSSARIPEAHNYIDTDGYKDYYTYFHAATVGYQKKLPDGSGYYAVAKPDADPTKAMEAVKRATIVYIYGHGQEGGGWISFDGGGWFAKWRKGIPKECAIDQNDFRTVKFIGFVGCKTALNSPVDGNLLDEAIKQGATTALGFREELGYDPSNIPNDPGIIWTKEFWKAALGWLDENEDGRLDPPKRVKDAASYAAEKVKNRIGSYQGYNLWDIKGDKNLLLAPAKSK